MKNNESIEESSPEEKKLSSQIEVVQDSEGRTINVFVIEQDKKFDLYEFLPKGVRFNGVEFLGYKFHYGNPPSVTFVPSEANSVSGRLGILHEMGHAQDAERHNFQRSGYVELQRCIFLIVRDIRASNKYQKLKLFKDKQNYIAKEFQKARKNFPALKSDEAVLESIKNLAHDERVAWANALRLYRRIKKEKNTDLLDGSKTKEIFEIIESDLSSYQNEHEILIPEQQVKLFIIKRYLPERQNG